MNRKSWEKIFKDPGADYRSKPFWSWNGKMEEKELFRQLDILKEMGFGGAFMHSRAVLVIDPEIEVDFLAVLQAFLHDPHPLVAEILGSQADSRMHKSSPEAHFF